MEQEGFSREAARHVDEKLREIFDPVVDRFVRSADEDFEEVTEKVTKEAHIEKVGEVNLETEGTFLMERLIPPQYKKLGLKLFKERIQIKINAGKEINLVRSAYGDAVSLAILLANTALEEFFLSSIQDDIDSTLTESQKNYVGVHSFHKSFSGTLRDALRSVGQVIGFMTAERIDGYDDVLDLLEAALDKKLFSQLSNLLPPGFVQPVAHKGLYYPQLLHVTDKGLSVRPEWKIKWKDIKEQMRKNPRLLDGNAATMEGCPVGKKGSSTIGETGVHKMAEIFYKYFIYFYEKELEKEAA